MNKTPKHTLSLKAYLLKKAKQRRTWFAKHEIQIWVMEHCQESRITYLQETAMRRIRELADEGFLEQSTFKGVRSRLAKYRIL